MREAAIETLLRFVSCILLAVCAVVVVAALLADALGWLILAAILFVLAVFFGIWARRT